MEKIDFKKELKYLYLPLAKVFSIVDVPEMNFLMVDGKGNPNTSRDYVNAIEALYLLSYTIKFMIKKGKKKIDYGVPPLEGLWWVPDMKDFSAERKNDWLWTMMIMQPDFVTKSIFNDAREIVKKKKNPIALDYARLESYLEGLCAQILYFGAYKDEGPTIQKLHAFIRESGCNLSGKHHEIYLGDPRKTSPEKLKTIIRQQIKK